MSQSLSTSISLTINGTYTNPSNLVGSADAVAQIVKSVSESLTSGTGLQQSDRIYAATRTLAATTSENLDLAGSLIDAFGATLTFVKVKLILIRLKTLTPGYVLAVGGAASNQFINWVANSSDIVNVNAGGVLLLYAPDAAGYGVTASTGDLLKINNANAASVDYEIIIVGTSA